MTSPVIPAPVRFDHDGGGFTLRASTPVVFDWPDIAAIVERFCAEVDRRIGVRLTPRPADGASGGPSVRIERVTEDELGMLPPPVGLAPTGGDAADERHSLTITADHVAVRAVAPAGVWRGLTTLLQLVASTPGAVDGAIPVPGGRILDAPRYAWRGLSLDVARTFFTVDEVRRVVDLLSLYKLNVLHLHLTDDQGWRLPLGRPATSPLADDAHYEVDDLRALVAYAADRFVTIVPEVDTPGHVRALVQLHPELDSGRNRVTFELAPGHQHEAVWLDPELPATYEVVDDVLAGLAEIFPGPYIHFGADEPWGMPSDLYSSYVQDVRERIRALGKRPLGWQESARAGLGADDVVQYWYHEIDLDPSLPPEVRAQAQRLVARSRQEVDTAVAASTPVIVSPHRTCYLDVPYAEEPADPAQTDRRRRLGLRFYAPKTIEDSFDWEPGEVLGEAGADRVAGVEAAIWAETITGFDDLCFLLLPRLAGVAQKAWSPPHGTTWSDHRDRLARHSRLWRQSDLTFFRAPAVDWHG